MPHTNAGGKDTQGENHPGGVSVILSMINVKSARDKNPRRVLSAFKMRIVVPDGKREKERISSSARTISEVKWMHKT